MLLDMNIYMATNILIHVFLHVQGLPHSKILEEGHWDLNKICTSLTLLDIAIVLSRAGIYIYIPTRTPSSLHLPLTA